MKKLQQRKEPKKPDKPKVTPPRTSYQPKIVAAKVPGSLDDISYPSPDPNAPTVSEPHPTIVEPSAPPAPQVIEER